MMDFSVTVTGAKETVAALKAADANAIKKLRQELKGVMKSEVSTIVSGIPAFAPIRGMAHNGRSKWKRPKGNVAFTPGAVRGFAGKEYQPLVTLTFTGGSNAIGFDMAELAGIRRQPARRRSKIANSSSYGTQPGDGSHANNGQGDFFISKLEEVRPIKGKAGRFAFDIFLRRKPIIQQKAIGFLDKYFKTTIERAA
jgi:hypothetical protein